MTHFGPNLGPNLVKMTQKYFFRFFGDLNMKNDGSYDKIRQNLKKWIFGPCWDRQAQILGLKIFSGLFAKPGVKHNGNRLEYAKSAKSNVVNLRKLRKIQFLGQFGPIWASLDTCGLFWRQDIFFFKNPKTSLFQTY